jgi:mono/diheme cytochrome c family protein
MAALLAVLIFLVCAQSVSAQRIVARPLTLEEIGHYELPEGTFASGGLFTVGIGEPLYLEVQVPTGTVATSVEWSVAPVEYYVFPAPVSNADIEDSPLPLSIPVYAPTDIGYYDAVSRVMFVPDVAGKYRVQAIVTTAEGVETLQQSVFGAKYVGVGTMGGTSPEWPQCGVCHEEKTVSFMETDHASFLTLAIDGQMSSHYSENCIECHVLGGNVPDAQNDNFFNAAEEAGWTWPEVLEPGNWDAMPPEVQAKANIQCEHCHGAGSLHLGNPEGISLTLDSGACGQCHDDGHYHVKNEQWNLSAHAKGNSSTHRNWSSSCLECHSGLGFIEELDGIANADKTPAPERVAIGCATCHDPHSAEHPGQLRTVADVVLENDDVISMGGAGKLCMNCHKSRSFGDEEVGTEPGTISSRFGPHHGPQAELFNGMNLIDYGKFTGVASPHAYALDNSCATCHMQNLNPGNPATNMAGGHTFSLSWDGGTPDDDSDDIDVIDGCVTCHGPMDSFDDMKRNDFNYDGVVESVQQEIEHLLEALAMKLPPVGEPEVVIDSKAVYSVAVKSGIWNYLTVEEDKSLGMHNPRYVAAALTASVEDLSDPFNDVFSGYNVPVGGDWFYSNWFEFYAPTEYVGWIYHYELGYQMVDAREDGTIWLYDLLTMTWVYTTAEIYPVMYVPTEGTWVYYGGKYNNKDRAFYDYSSGKWSFSN